MITGRSLEPMEVLIRLHSELAHCSPTSSSVATKMCTAHYYEVSVSHETGFFLFTDIQGQFRAQIKDVTPEGRLVLQREDGWERAYAFKEVRFDAE